MSLPTARYVHTPVKYYIVQRQWYLIPSDTTKYMQDYDSMYSLYKILAWLIFASNYPSYIYV